MTGAPGAGAASAAGVPRVRQVMISCGEPSGDLYAGALVASLRDLDPAIRVFGFGGERLHAAGAALDGDYRGFSVTGLVEAASVLPRSWRMLRTLSALDLARPPSALALRALPNVVGDEGAAMLARALPGSGLRRLDLRHTGVTGRGARLLVEVLRQGTDLELLGLGSGIPRRLKRGAAPALREPAPPADDIAAIASVYR